ncbi:unnamed protein product [Rotaria socialis]
MQNYLTIVVSISTGENFSVLCNDTVQLPSWLQKILLQYKDHPYEQDGNSNIETASKSSVNAKHAHVKVLELYRFADRQDKLMLAIGLIMVLINGINFPLFLVITAKILGEFFQHATGYCHLDFDVLNKRCPLGIEIDQYNFFKYQNICHININEVNHFQTWPEVKQNVNKKILVLFLLGLLQFFVSFTEFMMFDISAKRQASRIRAILLRITLFKNIPYFDKYHKTGEIQTKLIESTISSIIFNER